MHNTHYPGVTLEIQRLKDKVHNIGKAITAENGFPSIEIMNTHTYYKTKECS